MDREQMHEWLKAVSLTENLQNMNAGPPQMNFFHENTCDSEDDEIYLGNSHEISSDEESDELVYDSNDSNDSYSFLRYRQHSNTGAQEKYFNQVSSSTEETEKQLPKWFINRPLQYNARILYVALPGAIYLFVLGGEMFLTILCIGGLLIYLFHSSGFPSRALSAYLITCSVVVIYMLYVCLPFLWKSSLNIILILTVGGHTALTASWILLSFPEFRKKEPEICHLIEFLLFSVFPILTVILISWFAVNMMPIKTGPYIIMAVGYPIIQSFLQPTLSSFYKAPTGKPEDNFIINSVHASLILVTFSVYPCLLHLLGSIFKGSLFHSEIGLELIFLMSTNLFLVIVLDTGQLVNFLDVPEKYVKYGRFGAVIVTIVLLPFVLYIHGYQSTLLPWLPVYLIMHTGFGYSLYLKINETVIFCFGGGLFILYSVIFYHLPWSMNYYIIGNVHISMILALLYANIVLTLECVLAYKVFNPDELGLSIIAQTILIVATQKILEVGQLINVIITVCSSIAASYIFLKLYHWKKMALEHAEVCVCLHMTAVFTSIFQINGNSNVDVVKDTGSFIIVALFFLVLNKHLLFPYKCKDLALKQVGMQVILVFLVTGINLILWFPVLCEKLIGTTPNASDYLGCILLTTAAVTWRMSSQFILNEIKFVAQFTFLCGIVMFIAQPNTDISWENAIRWMLMMLLLQLLLLNKAKIYLRKSRYLQLAWSLLCGFPVGLIICNFVFAYEDTITFIITGFVCAILVGISLCVFLESNQLEKELFTGLGILLSTVFFVMTGAFYIGLQHSLYMYLICLVSLVTSIVLKLQSLRKYSMQLTRDGNVSISKLPLTGNILTITAMVFSYSFSPWELQFWIPTSSCTLLLLQEDHIVLKSFFRGSHNLSPSIIVATFSILVFTVVNSGIWTNFLWIWLTSILEIIVIILTFPVLINFWTILWCDTFYISDYYTVFAVPLYLILLLVGSSNMAYCLCIAGLCSGIWLMKEKLPLIR